jgi:hypothetical protein
MGKIKEIVARNLFGSCIEFDNDIYFMEFETTQTLGTGKKCRFELSKEDYDSLANATDKVGWINAYYNDDCGCVNFLRQFIGEEKDDFDIGLVTF